MLVKKKVVILTKRLIAKNYALILDPMTDFRNNFGLIMNFPGKKIK